MAKKTKAKDPNMEGVNQNLLNIVTPPGLDFGNTSANVGENVGRIYCISQYPATGVNYGWLSGLCNLEGTMTCIEYRHTTADRMTKVMNNRIKELKQKKETAKEESEKQVLEKSIKDIRGMINRISVRQEPVGYVNTLIFPQGQSEQELRARIKRISGQVAVEECSLRVLKYRQNLAYKAITPYGIPDYENVSNMGERNMPISTFVGGFPMASAGLNDKDGYYLGKTRNKRLVRLNQWLRNRDRTNSNWLFTGIPGSGKSTAIKDILVKEFAFGTRIIIFDPEREYVDLAQRSEIRGDVISCGGGSKGRINPLHIRPSAKFTQTELEELKQETLVTGEKLENIIAYDPKGGQSDLYIHLQQLRVFFRLYLGSSYTAVRKALLERCLLELYSGFGIEKDTDVSNFTAEQFPIMEELYKILTEKSESDPNIQNREDYRTLALLLESVAIGADSDLWNGYTTLKENSAFVVLDVSMLLDLDDNVKRAQFHNITNWGWGEMSRDRAERVIFVVDEGYLFVDPESPELMKTMRNISKRDRKYECGLMFITHSVVDILDESVRRYGQAIADNATYKFIMGTDGKNLKETKELFNLSDQEEVILAGKNRGQGILFCGGTRMDLRMDVCDELLAMFGTAGGR